MELTEHYRRFFRAMLRFAVLMLVVGGLMGLVYQEMSKSLTYLELEPGLRIEGLQRLAILHGHSFLIGTLMPIVWLAMLYFSLLLGAAPITPRGLKWIYWTYVPSAVSVIALILYKGTHFILELRDGNRDFVAINQGVFGGNKLLRGLAYGGSHTLATISLGIFAVYVWRALSRVKQP